MIELDAHREDEEAQRALLARPRVSMPARIAAVFLPLFLLMCGITAAAVVFLSSVASKLQFLEKASNHLFEIQQARRFEKNFFLYGTNLGDALNNIHTAESELDRSADEFRAVMGPSGQERMKRGLAEYAALLDELLATADRAPTDPAARRAIEARLRRSGAAIVSEAEEMVDRERLAVRSLLHTSTVVAIAFLVMMAACMSAIAVFLAQAVVGPLRRFVRYAERIGSGDESPIRPTRRYRDEFSDLAVSINRMLSELKQRREQLVHAGKMAAIGTLTSGIAHELNNPLNNIALTTETLLDGGTELAEDAKRRMLEQLYAQVERASATVRNLLDFARKETPAFTSVSVREVVDSTLRLVRNELTLSGVEALVDFPADIPRISGNPRNLQQVFTNLFLNAIQAMPRGGRLTVRGATQDDGLRIEVSDTGVGIPPDNLHKIFDPFFTTKEPGQGTGLGLSVSFGIIEKHGGTIAVASEPGRGTTFTIHLPFAEPRRRAAVTAGEEPR